MTAINSNRAIRGPVTAVPVVAGKGVRLVADTENNRIVAEADETVLWEGTLNTLNSDVSCSESIYNFDRIKVFYRIVANNTVQSVAAHEFEPAEISSTNFVSFGSFYVISNGWYGWWICRLTVTDNNKIKITKTLNTYGNNQSMAGCTVDTSNIGFIYKIVGINRISASA
jgi:hypothetical protein